LPATARPLGRPLVHASSGPKTSPASPATTAAGRSPTEEGAGRKRPCGRQRAGRWPPLADGRRLKVP
jgi:hypothetical protein